MSSKSNKNSVWDVICSCGKVTNVVKFEWKDNVRKVEIDDRPVLVWVHYHKDNEFFGWSVNKREELKMSGLSILHGFIGPKSSYYSVPDDDLESNRFKLSNQDKNGKHRKLNKNAKNRKLLNKEYSGVERFFGPTEGLSQ